MHTLDDLKKHLDYDAESGVFTWKAGGRKRKHGSIAGTYDNGYLYIFLEGARYAAHRLAWLFITGEWPEQVIDHINGTRDDNRANNLRDVSLSDNFKGFRAISSRNTSGYRGVSWNSRAQCFTASKMTDGKAKFLGCFDTAEEAHTAYLNADNLPATAKTYRPRRASVKPPIPTFGHKSSIFRIFLGNFYGF